MTMSIEHPIHDQTYTVIILCLCLSFFFLPVATAPLTLSCLLALTIWLFSGRCYKDRADWLHQGWFLPVGALCVLPWVAILWSPAPVEEAFKFALRSHYWLFALVAASALKSERALRIVMACFVSGCALIAVIQNLYLAGILPQTAYLQKFSAHSYITYSLLVVIAVLLLAFFYATSTTRINKLLIAALMLFLVFTITHLKGRSAYLSLALLSPWLFITMFGRRRLIPIVVAVLVTLALICISQRVQERIALIPKEIKLYQAGVSSSYQLPDGSTTPSSVGLRMMMWNDALKIFLHHPFFGAGTGSYQLEAQKINPENALPHPHNSYLYILANFGLAGIALYGWLLVITLKRAWQSRQHISGHSILAFVAVILIGGLTDTQVLSVATGIALGFMAGLPTPPSTS